MTIRLWHLAVALVLCGRLAVAGQAVDTFYSEGFEGVALGPNVEETRGTLFPVGTPGLWSKTGPTDWAVENEFSIDDGATLIGVPNIADVINPETGANDYAAAPGVEEWEGWNFVRKDFFTSEGQGRQFWSRGTGTVAVADPDEYDDQASGIPGGPARGVDPVDGVLKFLPGAVFNPTYNTRLKSALIDISSVPAGQKVYVSFDSTFRGEDPTDEGDDNQTAIVSARTGADAFGVAFATPVELLHWESRPLLPDGVTVVGTGVNPNYKPGIQEESPAANPFANQSVLLSFDKVDGEDSLDLAFTMLGARNDWWWAIDNLKVGTGAMELNATERTTFNFGEVTGMATLADVIDLSVSPLGTANANDVVEVLGMQLFGDTAVFSVPDFAPGFLTVGELMELDVKFLGARFAKRNAAGAIVPFGAILNIDTSAGSIAYQLAATQVPEPATAVILAGAAGLALAFVRRK